MRFNCPNCTATFQVKDELAGKKARCEKCGSRFVIPIPQSPQTGRVICSADEGPDDKSDLKISSKSPHVICGLAADLLRRPAEVGNADAVARLISGLTDRECSERHAAVSALSKLKDARVVPALIQALGDRADQVVEVAARALGSSGDIRAVEPLIRLLNLSLGDTTYEKSVSAAKSLGEIGHPLAFAPLVAMLRRGGSNLGLPGKVATALGKIGDIRAIEPLFDYLDSNKVFDDGHYIYEAIVCLGKRGGVEAVINGLKARKPLSRSYAARALGQIGDLRAVGPLCLALQDQNHKVRSHAASALGQIGDPRAVDPLSLALHDQNHEVRDAARGALVLPAFAGVLPQTVARQMDADVLAEGRPRPMTARAILLAMNIEEPLVWEEGNYESGEHFSIAPKEQLGLEACLTAYAAEIVAHRDMGWIGLNNGRELNRPLLLATLDYRSGRASSHQRYRFLHRVAADSFQIYEYEALGWGSD